MLTIFDHIDPTGNCPAGAFHIDNSWLRGPTKDDVEKEGKDFYTEESTVKLLFGTNNFIFLFLHFHTRFHTTVAKSTFRLVPMLFVVQK